MSWLGLFYEKLVMQMYSVHLALFIHSSCVGFFKCHQLFLFQLSRTVVKDKSVNFTVPVSLEEAHARKENIQRYD